MTEVRPLRWHDLPFAYRLVRCGTSFDAQLRLTVGDNSLRRALLFGSGRTNSYILRRSDGEGLGQLHYPADTLHARLAYLAPSLQAGATEGLWLGLLDGLAAMAGQRGMTSITAEVGEDSLALAVLRRANFAVYARQDMWVRAPAPVSSPTGSLRLAHLEDEFAMQALYGALVPALIQQVEPPPTTADICYVLDDSSGGICGLIPVYRGRRRALMEIYLHPEVHDLARDVVRSTLAAINAGRNTVYCRLRRYMEWLDSALAETGFNMIESQAVMTRRTAVRITQPAFKKLHAVDGGIPTTPIEVLQPASGSPERHG